MIKLFNISFNPSCFGKIPFSKTLKLHEYLVDKSDNLKHNSINFSASIFLFLGLRIILILSSDSSKTSSNGIFLLFIKCYKMLHFATNAVQN